MEITGERERREELHSFSNSSVILDELKSNMKTHPGSNLLYCQKRKNYLYILGEVSIL